MIIRKNPRIESTPQLQTLFEGRPSFLFQEFRRIQRRLKLDEIAGAIRSPVPGGEGHDELRPLNDTVRGGRYRLVKIDMFQAAVAPKVMFLRSPQDDERFYFIGDRFIRGPTMPQGGRRSGDLFQKGRFEKRKYFLGCLAV